MKLKTTTNVQHSSTKKTFPGMIVNNHFAQYWVKLIKMYNQS